MKKFFFGILAIAAFVACSNEEQIAAPKGEAIAFGNAFVDNSVRAIDPSYGATNVVDDQEVTNHITSFKVWGTANDVLIYDDAVVEKGSASYNSEWSCNAAQQYWIPGAVYNFVGIVDGDVEGVTTTAPAEGMPTTITYNADGKTDLLCQTIRKTALASNNGLVAFNFTHLLSKVNFTVVNNSTGASGYSFVVKNIKFNGYTTGVCNVASLTEDGNANAAWGSFSNEGDTFIGNTRTVNDQEVKDIVVDAGAASAELATEVLFLPGTQKISFDVDILYDGKTITTTSYPAAGATYSYALVANTAYNFKVEVSVGEPIKFTVEKLPKWDNGNTVDSNGDNEKDIVPVVPAN